MTFAIPIAVCCYWMRVAQLLMVFAFLQLPVLLLFSLLRQAWLWILGRLLKGLGELVGSVMSMVDTEAPIEVLVAITVHTGQTTQEPLESLYNVSI